MAFPAGRNPQEEEEPAKRQRIGLCVPPVQQPSCHLPKECPWELQFGKAAEPPFLLFLESLWGRERLPLAGEKGRCADVLNKYMGEGATESPPTMGAPPRRLRGRTPSLPQWNGWKKCRLGQQRLTPVVLQGSAGRGCVCAKQCCFLCCGWRIWFAANNRPCLRNVSSSQSYCLNKQGSCQAGGQPRLQRIQSPGGGGVFLSLRFQFKQPLFNSSLAGQSQMGRGPVCFTEPC